MRQRRAEGVFQIRPFQKGRALPGDAAGLAQLRARFVSKKGEIPALMRNLGKLPQEDRPAYGAAVQTLREAIEGTLDRTESILRAQALSARLENERLDVTLEGADAMHAWVQAWCGANAGWIEFDPTNAMMAGLDHIVAARGRDYSDVAPVRGVLRTAGAQDISQFVDVIPLA